MYCKKCGRPLPEGEKFCSSCGNAVETEEQQGKSSSIMDQIKQINTMVLVGFIVSCISPCFPLLGVAGLILSFIGYRQIAGTNQKGKNLAIAGMVIGGILTLLIVGAFLLAFSSIIWLDSNLFR